MWARGELHLTGVGKPGYYLCMSNLKVAALGIRDHTFIGIQVWLYLIYSTLFRYLVKPRFS